MSTQAIRALLEAHEWVSGSGVSTSEVAEAENAIGPLPGDFKEFLLRFGWLEFGSYEVYGLGSGKPDYLDVMRMTLLERTQPAVPLPEGWVCVMNDGAGNLVSFDTGDVVGNAEYVPVYLWNHELGTNQDPEVLAGSFHGWLVSLLQEEVE